METRAAPLRTIHVAAGLARDAGGPPVSVFNFSVCSLAAGIHAEIATTYDPHAADSTMIPQIEALGTTVHPFRRAVLFRKYSKRWGISFTLFRWILQEARRYDLVIIHGAWLFSSLAA